MIGRDYFDEVSKHLARKTEVSAITGLKEDEPYKDQLTMAVARISGIGSLAEYLSKAVGCIFLTSFLPPAPFLNLPSLINCSAQAFCICDGHG